MNVSGVSAITRDGIEFGDIRALRWINSTHPNHVRPGTVHTSCASILSRHALYHVLLRRPRQQHSHRYGIAVVIFFLRRTAHVTRRHRSRMWLRSDETAPSSYRILRVLRPAHACGRRFR